MVTLPLVGWSMLSAGSYPIVLFNGIVLPPILPHDIVVYGVSQVPHTWLAFASFAVFLAHPGAALFHGLVRQDGVLSSMASCHRR